MRETRWNWLLKLLCMKPFGFIDCDSASHPCTGILSVSLSFTLSTCLSVYMSVTLSICLLNSVSPPVYLPPSLSPSVHPSVCPVVSLSLSPCLSLCHSASFLLPARLSLSARLSVRGLSVRITWRQVGQHGRRWWGNKMFLSAQSRSNPLSSSPPQQSLITEIWLLGSKTDSEQTDRQGGRQTGVWALKPGQ